MLDAGEGGVIFEMVNYLEETWPLLAKEPPDVADVMYNFVVEKAVTSISICTSKHDFH